MIRVKNKMSKGFVSRLIYSILKSNIDSRDNWLLTLKEVHDRELALYGFEKTDYYDCVFSYKLTNPQTISRIWRKIQEVNVELRGTEWEERQQLGGQIAIEVATSRFSQLNLF
jgi:hypothetical protein